MKKIYNNVIGTALGALICVGLAFPAQAQRGGEHSDGKSSGGGGGSTPPPAAPAPQRPAPQPVQQAQPQVQRSNPQPQQQQQVQRNYPQQQQQQPQMQRSNPQPQQQQNNTFNRPQGNNAVGGSTTYSPRGQEHQQEQTFRPANPNGARRYPGIGQRNNTYAPRGYGNPYRGGNGYRSYPGLAYGRNRITVRPRGFYYNNRGYYATYYRPQLGFSLSILPYGYYPFYFGSDQYYYSDGLYYRQQQDNSYSVVEPPVGATIDKLPAKAQSIAINGMQYYELNGVYYQPITKDDGTITYQIAGKDGELNTADVGTSQDDLPQVGDLVDNLPEGCKVIRLNNQKYYVSQEGYYFQDAVDTNGDKVFKIVGTPTDAPGN